ncbi:uncharacterized protein LOC120994308 [Bufo bufo]|uniref:uncharacterized protein LOC120994308 n=1 Tax=Bufo bufo TaxID=8384 RepID=UPI001ABE73CF|nr:uncharacterized protein LOC120994308 [Bufo bufo]
MMTICRLVCLILTLQLVGGITSSPGHVSDTNVTEDTTTESSEIMWRKSVTETPANSETITARTQEPQEQQGQCAWWCNEFYGIIALASAGTVLLVIIILSIVSCCMWKRTKCTKQEGERGNNTDMKDMELDTLVHRAAPDSSRSFPVQEEPPAMKDEGVSDVENCAVNPESPKTETPQDSENQSTDGPAFPLPPPENIPMLP